jgi:tRNA(fMet)-specific endonuclease VapC
MPLFVLDTINLRLLARNAEPLASRVRSHPVGDLAIAVITVQESLDGWHALLRRAKSPAQIELAYQSIIDSVEHLNTFRILNFTQPAQVRFQGLLRMRLNVGGDDLRIAAIALEHQAKVVMANVRDFGRVPGLQVEDWTV